MSELIGKNILFYFSNCFQRTHTPKLIEAYHEIKAKDDAFEVIFIPRFSDPYSSEEQSTFDEFFSLMPWLALPFSDYVRNIRLYRWFKTGRWGEDAIFISSAGRTYQEYDALELVCTHRGDIYPFTLERFNFLKDQYEETERNQSLTSLLVSNSRDYLLSNDGNQVKLFFAVLLGVDWHSIKPNLHVVFKCDDLYPDISYSMFYILIIELTRFQSSFFYLINNVVDFFFFSFSSQ